MSKKKIVLSIVILLLVMVMLFMAITFRKFMIVKDLQNKIAMKAQAPNFYRKAVTTGENSEVVTEGYRKGDKIRNYKKNYEWGRNEDFIIW